MVSNKLINKSCPICDTNILINFGICNLLEGYVEHKDGINISDFVEKELIRKIDGHNDYKFIVDEVSNNSKINIIKKENYFSEDRINVINANLNEFGLKNNSFLTGTLCPDMGEFVNAIYAVNLKITEFISHDMRFINRYKSEAIFASLRMKNMVQALDGYIGKERRKELLPKWREENEKMMDALREAKVLKKFDQWQLKLDT